MTNHLTKIFVIFAGFILAVFFIVGVVQSIKLNNLLEQKAELQRQYEQVEIDYDFTQNPDYQDAFRRQEGNYGNKDDVIYE